jgi:hypothetical protein
MSGKITMGQLAARGARLLASVLLVGGMAAAPVAHPLASPDRVTASGHAGHEHGDSGVPDSHHDCATCITLAGGAVPLPSSVPSPAVSPRAGGAGSISELRDRDHTDSTRARAPPRV